MKTVILMRHAKSSWEGNFSSDHARPLNKRGKRDAPYMASWIAELNSIPELIVSSDSQRTRDTATFLLNEFRNTSIDFTNELYHASPHQILNVIHQVPNNVETVMVLAHNPGITYAFDSLASVNIDNVPTSGVGAIRFDVNSFHEIQPNSGKLEFFIYPKKPRN